MSLKEEIVKIGEREIKIHEISFQGQLRLESFDKMTGENLYSECMSEEDFKYLDTINKEDGKKVRDALNRVNGWNKSKGDDEDFQESPSEKENGK